MLCAAASRDLSVGASLVRMRLERCACESEQLWPIVGDIAERVTDSLQLIGESLGHSDGHLGGSPSDADR
jgi:hypothetical protein